MKQAPAHLTAILALLVSATPIWAQSARNSDTNPPPTATQRVPVVTSTSTPSPDDDEVIYLSRFEVTAESNSGYYASQTLAGSRINTKLEDVGSAISVITPEFLKDVGATDNKSLLAYTTNTEVGGTQGNFRGASGGQSEDESGRFTNPNGNTRVRGLTSADNTRNFFTSDIPWEGYNIDRVDMQRGPNSILFGLGSPAGIINTTTKVAHHRNFGSAEFRFGSYGSNRATLDWNQNLLKNELSVRINLLNNDERYRQDPAYSQDRRLFATLRYDPRFLNKGGTKTTLKVNYEMGKIDSNNPRTITPRDQITAWWDKMGKMGYDPRYVQNSGWFYDANGAPYRHPNSGQFNRNWSGTIPGNPATPDPSNPTKNLPWTVSDAGHALPDDGSPNLNFTPWLGAPVMYGGVWLQVQPGEVSPYYASMPEYKNIRGIGTNGAIDGSLGTPYARRVTVANTAYWAERANEQEGAKYQSFGVWKAATLTDSSVFDFYNNLLDGDNKEEWQNFKNFSASLTQSFFSNKVGYDLSYDYQNIDRGQYSFDGAGILYIDINTHNIDGTVNQHYGQPYIESNYIYGNNSYDSTRNAGRFTAFAEHNFNQGGKGGWFKKLLGRHTITGLLSTEEWKSDSRNFSRYGTNDDFAPLVANPGNARFISSGDRTVTPAIYLGDSLKDASTYRGAYIPSAAGKLRMPSSVSWHWFDSTWNGGGVNPADPWTNTYSGADSTQSENPANYVGWTNRDVKIMSAEGGDQDYLTRSATLNKRQVDSMAASWQAYFWDGAVVGLFGLRQDRVKTWALEGTRDATYDRVVFSEYNFENPNTKINVYTGNTKSWSAVVKLNQLLRNKLPVNVNLYYNQSDNFQVTNARNDLYGQPLPPPSGKTKDFGVMLSTKDQRYVLKVNKYESDVKNSSNSSINNYLWYLMGGDNFITRLESRADAYQYHLKTRDDFSSINYLDDANPRDPGTWQWYYTTLTGETEEHATLTRLAAVAAWRDLTTKEPIQKILQAWGYPDLNQNPIGQTSQANPKNLVANFQATEDQKSKGWEIEFTANPTKNWRVTINASKTEASRSNVGGAALTEFVTYANAYHNKRFVRVSGPGEGVLSVADGLYRNGTPGQTYYFREATAAEIEADINNIDKVTGSGKVNTTFGGIGNFPTWSGGGGRNGSMVSWNSNFYSKYLLMKLQEGTNATELRRWRVNFVTNYDFTSGPLKGVNVGLGYRWQDKVAIGYPAIEIDTGSIPEITFDINNPYYGPSLDAVDLWIGYQRALTRKINWRIQLNVRDVGAGKKLIPLSTQYDGTVAAWGIAPSQQWTITNTLSF